MLEEPPGLPGEYPDFGFEVDGAVSVLVLGLGRKRRSSSASESTMRMGCLPFETFPEEEDFLLGNSLNEEAEGPSTVGRVIELLWNSIPLLRRALTARKCAGDSR